MGLPLPIDISGLMGAYGESVIFGAFAVILLLLALVVYFLGRPKSGS